MFKSIEYGVIPGDVNEKTAQFLREHGWVDQHIGALNNILQSRWFVLSDSFLPRKYALKNSAMQSDYDHIDRAMQAEDQGKGTEHQRQNIDRLRREAKGLARQNLMTSPAIQSDVRR